MNLDLAQLRARFDDNKFCNDFAQAGENVHHGESLTPSSSSMTPVSSPHATPNREPPRFLPFNSQAGDDLENIAENPPDIIRSAEKKLKMSELNITDEVTENELLQMFKESELLEEQGDILHYLVYNKYCSYLYSLRMLRLLSLQRFELGHWFRKRHWPSYYQRFVKRIV